MRIFGLVQLPVELLEADRERQELAVHKACQDLERRLLEHLKRPEPDRPTDFEEGPFGRLEDPDGHG